MGEAFSFDGGNLPGSDPDRITEDVFRLLEEASDAQELITENAAESFEKMMEVVREQHELARFIMFFSELGEVGQIEWVKKKLARANKENIFYKRLNELKDFQLILEFRKILEEGVNTYTNKVRNLMRQSSHELLAAHEIKEGLEDDLSQVLPKS